MTPREQAAYNAGIQACQQMAMIAAVTIEVRDDAADLRQRAASAALLGLADGITALMVEAEPAAVSGAVSSMDATA